MEFYASVQDDPAGTEGIASVFPACLGAIQDSDLHVGFCFSMVSATFVFSRSIITVQQWGAIVLVSVAVCLCWLPDAHI